MKVAVVGNGNVGMATFQVLQNIQRIDELVLVGRNIEKVHGEVDDFKDAQVMRSIPGPKLSFGGYEATAGADIIVFSAGSSKIQTDDRLGMLKANVQISTEIFTEIKKVNPNPIIICQTNPLDVVVMTVQKVMGIPASRVIGTGDLLDSSRLKRTFSELFDISPKSIEAYVIGEHGNSSVPLLSSVRICGMSIDEYLSHDVDCDAKVSFPLTMDIVRKAGFKIFHEKGFTSSGVADAAGKIISAILCDTHEILPVSVVLNGEYGINGIATSVPCVIGREGVLSVKNIPMTDEEKELFAKSVETIGNAAKAAGVI